MRIHYITFYLGDGTNNTIRRTQIRKILFVHVQHFVSGAITFYDRGMVMNIKAGNLNNVYNLSPF